MTERLIAIMQGDHRISKDPAEVLATVLGSCVAACLRDPVAGIGGLNHFLLPGGNHQDRTAVKYGLHAMELLINGMIREGASRTRLEAKLFGGAQMLRGLPDIGKANALFAEDFLRREGIAYIGGSLGGTKGRKIRFNAVTGNVRQFLLDPSEAPEIQVAKPVSGDIVLF